MPWLSNNMRASLITLVEDRLFHDRHAVVALVLMPCSQPATLSRGGDNIKSREGRAKNAAMWFQPTPNGYKDRKLTSSPFTVRDLYTLG
jgi:hypothetical protein